MTTIDNRWTRRLQSQPSKNTRNNPRKRSRSDHGSAGDGDGPPGGAKRLTRKSTAQANPKTTGTVQGRTRSQGKERKKDGNGETQLAQQSPYPIPSPSARLGTL